MSVFILNHLLVDCVQFPLIHGPIPDSYTILFFAASGFTFIIRHIHSWVSYLHLPSHFIPSGAVGNSRLFSGNWKVVPPPSRLFLLVILFSSLDTFWPGRLIFWCHIFLAFYTVHEFLTASIPARAVCHSLLQRIMFCQNCFITSVY